MPQQTESAIITRVGCVGESFVGRKIRLVGRLLSYESDTGLILLLEGDAAVLVDVTLCVDRWIREHLSVIMVVGYVEACSEQLPIPTMPRYARAPAVDASLVIRAGLVVPVPDLDTDEWHQAVDDREAVIKWS